MREQVWERSPANFPRIDALHLGLMLLALALAYFLPFELVLLSYAVLGPLHYLTEISWLHERSYFSGQRSVALIMVVCAIVIVFLPWHRADIMIITLVFAIAFGTASGLCKTSSARVAVAAMGFIAGLEVIRLIPMSVWVVFLVPTVIHVSLFTFLFMFSGALRSKSRSQLILAIAYLSCIGAILVCPPSAKATFPIFDAWGPRFFGEIGTALNKLFSRVAGPFDARLSGFLSFIYTYHYLNWFVKVKVIKWDDVPKRRLVGISIISAGSTALYFINYPLGVAVLLSLSVLHVLLELPLNAISVRDLIRSLAQAIRATTATYTITGN